MILTIRLQTKTADHRGKTEPGTARLQDKEQSSVWFWQSDSRQEQLIIGEKLNQALRDCKTKNNLQYDSDSQTPDKNSWSSGKSLTRLCETAKRRTTFSMILTVRLQTRTADHRRKTEPGTARLQDKEQPSVWFWQSDSRQEQLIIVEKLNQALRDCKTKNDLQYDSDSQTPDKNNWSSGKTWTRSARLQDEELQHKKSSLKRLKFTPRNLD